VLPSWIAQPASPRSPRSRGSARFLERTLRESARVVEDAVFAERCARQPGLLQSLNPRLKLLSVLALLVAATFLHHLPSLWALAVFVIACAALSGIRARLLFNRVWWFVPGIFVIVALPAMLSWVTPGDPLAVLYRAAEPPQLGPVHLPAELTITRQGLASALLVVTRLLVGVSLALLLALTTRWQDLLKAAYTTATAPFVFTLAMMYRYLFVLLRVVENMHLGKRARTISPEPLAGQHRWIGGRIAFLFSRSRRLSEEVYQAMLARGYLGEPRALAAFSLRGLDAAWALACGVAIIALLLLDRKLLGGLPW